MTPKELEKIYELTYKYGWLTAIERKENWLSDKAYMEKAKIEGELATYIDYGLEDLSETYFDWIVEHADQSTLELYDEFETVKRNSNYTKSYEPFVEFLEKWWVDDAENVFDGLVNKYIGDDVTYEMTYIELYEKHPEIFDNVAKEVEDMIPEIFMNQFSKETGWYTGSREIITKAFDKYKELQDSRNLSMNNKIITFQEALHFAHFNGEMSDFILDNISTISARKLLDELSAGAFSSKWNGDLKNVLGYDPTEKIASIIDYVRETLDKNIWDISGKEVKLQPDIKDQIEDVVYSALDDLDLPDSSLQDLFVYGSLLTNQYNPRTDFDCRIVLDPKMVYEKYGKNITGDDLFDLVTDIIHGIPLEPTKHPLNCTIVIEGEKTELGQAPLGKTEKDPVYDVLNDRIVVSPAMEEEFDPDKKFEQERDEAEEIMTRLDKLIQDAKTDSIDYQLIEEAVADVKDPDKLISKLEKKLDQMESTIEELVSEYTDIKEERTKGYGEDRDPGSKGNVVFKILEKYKYVDLLRKLKQIFKGGVTDGEVDEIQTVLNIARRLQGIAHVH